MLLERIRYTRLPAIGWLEIQRHLPVHAHNEELSNINQHKINKTAMLMIFNKAIQFTKIESFVCLASRKSQVRIEHKIIV